MRVHDEIFELIPLHALDALEGFEDARVTAHVSKCLECRSELDRHRSVAASLAGEDTLASSALWSRIEAAIDNEPGPSTIAHLVWNRPGRVLLAAAAMVALFLSGLLVGQRVATEDPLTAEGIVAAAEIAFADPQSRTGEFFVEGQSVARVVIGSDGIGYLIPADRLPTLVDDRTYQLWVITPGELVISAGVLGNQPTPAVFTWTDDIAGFALTREVGGGVVSSAGDVVSAITDF